MSSLSYKAISSLVILVYIIMAFVETDVESTTRLLIIGAWFAIMGEIKGLKVSK